MKSFSYPDYSDFKLFTWLDSAAFIAWELTVNMAASIADNLANDEDRQPDMKPGDRELIVKPCLAAEEDKIIITHGTDMMAVTAALPAKKVKGKTIVLIGAMIPYKFGSSDGFFNLGFALAFVQALPQGVYASMNGRHFNRDNVKKNRETGIFEEVR